MLTESSLRHVTAHIAGAGTAMAGATIAASAALACSLGEACVRLNIPQLTGAELQRAERSAARLAALRQQLLALADEDGAAITAFAALRDAGQVLAGQDRLCEMPLIIGHNAQEAAAGLQEFRPLAARAADDLEMTIRLLHGAAQAATLLLDSNLRIWPEPTLLTKYEPQLAALRSQTASLRPVERLR